MCIKDRKVTLRHWLSYFQATVQKYRKSLESSFFFLPFQRAGAEDLVWKSDAYLSLLCGNYTKRTNSCPPHWFEQHEVRSLCHRMEINVSPHRVLCFPGPHVSNLAINRPLSLKLQSGKKEKMTRSKRKALVLNLSHLPFFSNVIFFTANYW